MYECLLLVGMACIIIGNMIFPLCESCARRMQEYAIFVLGSFIALPVLIHALAQNTHELHVSGQANHELSYHVMLSLCCAYAILVLGVFSRVWYRPANFGRLLLTWSISPILLVLAICGLGKDA